MSERAEVPVAPDNMFLQSFSAGEVGCLPEEIRVSHYDSVRRNGAEVLATWLASCRGHEFVCTYNQRQTLCHEQLVQ